jgi:ABC-2 type transport system permease protein
MSTGLKATILRELHRLCSRKIYIFAIFCVPLGMAFFFLNFLEQGLPLKTPTAVVDLDHSAMSRGVTRSLNASELLDVTLKLNSYDEAITAVKRGDIYGFFLIPDKFQEDALSGRKPTLNYYSNMTYFVPGTFTFKGFKTISVTTSGGIVRSTLLSLGADGQQIKGLIQPVVIESHPIGNPWLSYDYYLGPSFIFGLLSMMIMLTTVFSITMELKSGSSVDWLKTAGDRILTAVVGKLLPQTIAFCAVALFILWAMIGWCHFPQNGNLAWLIAALLLMVIASQAFALLISSLVPNPRMAFSVTALISILTFSFAGFSFPVTSMYGSIAIFSYIVPVRHFFLIYLNQALNGFDIYYVRYSFVALLIFPLIACLLLKRLKRACANPVYVP